MTKDNVKYQVIKDAVNNGTLTGETPATVEGYNFSVKRIYGQTEIEQHDDRGDEQQRRDEKHGLFGEHEDVAN